MYVNLRGTPCNSACDLVLAEGHAVVVQVQIDPYVHLHTHMRTHIHTHTNAHTHTHSQPLMQRVQAALGAQLTRQNEKLEIELREKVRKHIIRCQCYDCPIHPLCPQLETLKGLQGERESLGVELYGIQQQLARQQMLVEREADEHTQYQRLREQREETLGRVREMYRETQGRVKAEEQQSESEGGTIVFVQLV